MLERLKNFLDSVSRECGKTFREDAGFFALLNILNISVFLEVIVKNPETKTELMFLVIDHAEIFLLGTVQIFILCVAIHFLFSRLPEVKKFVQIVTGIYFFLVCVTDIFLIFKFQTVMMHIVMATILGTNPFSVKEFLRDYILKPYVFALLVAGVGFIFLTVKALKNFLTGFLMTRVFEKISQPVQRFLIVGILIVLTGLWSHWIYRAYAFGDWNANKKVVTSTAAGRVSMTFYYFVHNFPIGDEKKIFAEMDKQNEAEKILEDKSEIPYIIYVIGESADRNHMSLYGYRLETNPLLQKRFDAGELIRFNDRLRKHNAGCNVDDGDFRREGSSDERLGLQSKPFRHNETRRILHDLDFKSKSLRRVRKFRHIFFGKVRRKIFHRRCIRRQGT